MEYADEDKGGAGRIPECGAIFMANAVTKKECFRHDIFALPASMTGFLKHVKAGMVLFMFEYEKRNLFGVYQAISDGAIDIVPHAFHRVGKHFPAQVNFGQIWNCYPLSENVFRDAIRENYFSAKKFNFGLSEDQVHRLLLLFSARKLKNKLPTSLEAELISQSYFKDRRLIGDDMFLLNKGTYMEPKGGFDPSLLHDYEDNSLSGANEFSINRIHKEGKINSDDHGILIDYSDEYFTKRRRLDNDGRLVLNKVTEHGIYNCHSPLRFTCIDSQKDSLNEEGKLGDNCRGSSVDWVPSENQVGRNPNLFLSAEHFLHPWDIRMTDGDILMHRNRILREFNRDIGFGEAFETGCFGKPLNRSRPSIDNDRFLIDDCIQAEYIASNAVKQRNQDLVVQERESTNDHQCSANVNFGNRYHVQHDGILSASTNPCSVFHKVRKTTSDGNLPINERIESEPTFPALEADHNTILEWGDLPDHGSLVPCYTLSSNSSLPYFSESKASCRCLDIAPDCENRVSVVTTSSCQSSDFHDATNSCLKSNSIMVEDLDTPAMGYRGSLFSKHLMSSVPHTGVENVGVRKRLPLVYKSDEHHYGHGGNVSNESHHLSRHVPYKTLDMLAGKTLFFPKEKYFGEHVYEAECDLRSNDAHFLKMAHNMNLKEHQEHSVAPHLSSNIRKSVFTRMTSGQHIQFDEERNGDHLNSQDCYMDASADEVMEMLHRVNNLAASKLKNIRMVGQHNDGETSLDGKQMNSHIDVNQLINEKKMWKDAHLATEEGSNKMPEETRIVDFKRRSETKKRLVGIGTNSVVIKNIIDDGGEAESSAKKIFKRKRLVRPVFRENELAVDNLVSEKNTWFPGQFLVKDDEQHFESAIYTSEAQITDDDSRSNNVLSLGSQQYMNDTRIENTSQLAQKGPEDNILSSTHHGHKRHASLNVDLEKGS